jgi:probable rRNA maturation factor
MSSNNNSIYSVYIKQKGKIKGIAPKTVERIAFSVLNTLNLKPSELSVLLCDDSVIHELNRTYRKKDTPTDVLSFPMEEEPSAPFSVRLLGDVIISVETAKRQAVQNNVTLRNEVTRLLVHGILHLTGYIHNTDKQEARMNRKSDWIFEQLLLKHRL